MVAAIPTTTSRLLFSGSRSSLSRLSPSQLCALRAKTLISYSPNNNKIHDGPGAGGVSVEARCSARATTTRTAYEIETLTTWLLKEEMAGNIDSELAIVLSSISLACKQIASLLQRSSITNLTGLQGTVNVQGEDQKKLDVVSNERNQVEQKCIVNVCQPGSNLLGAGYCMYSSSVIFALSIGKGVFAFTLDPLYGEFVLTQENIKVPKSGKIYSFNEGNYELWDSKLKKYIDDLRDPNSNRKPYSARYIGCLVGEIHRMLFYGGIYGSPKNKNSKNGNLRLLYECAPMSYIVEQAGGKASDGHQRILDIHPEEIHQRTPLFIGSPEEVDKLEKYLA